MIVPLRKVSWFLMMFDMRGSILPRISRRLVTVFVVACLVTLEDRFAGGFEYDLTTLPFTLVSLALAVVLGFRNNTGYDRFWEGRKLWGRLVNDARSFARLVLNVIEVDAVGGDSAKLDPTEVERLQHELVYLTMGYVHSLRLHLRKQVDDCLSELAPFMKSDALEDLRVQHNVPLKILQLMSEYVQRARRAAILRNRDVHLLENLLTDVCDVQGGCERIKNTPIPWSYTVLIHSLVAAYCLALPFGLIATTKLATPIVVVMISYAFLGLDAVGDELEDPFGTDMNDLPLSTLSRMIEVNLRQLLGETDLPAFIQPDTDRVAM
jgi:putative membrane protein